MRASAIQLRPDLDYLRRLQRFIRRFCDRHGVEEALHGRVQLACEEWFVNVVKHGFGGGADAAGSSGPPRITVRLGLARTGELVVRLADNAPPFNPDDHPLPDLSSPAEQRPIGGLGVYLIRKLASRYRYERADGRNELTLHMAASGERKSGSEYGEEPT